jgi:hypothetical protein
MPDEADKNQMQVSVNLDNTPVLYTDNIQMTANEDGVVLDVMQKLGNTNQARVVSRIGMSLEHAKKFAQMLGQYVVSPKGMQTTGKKSVN